MTPVWGKQHRSIPFATTGGHVKNRIYFREARAVGRYEGLLKKSIHLVKYRRKIALSKGLAELMINYINNCLAIENFDYLIPVPLYKRQYRKRGFNQTELLVNEIGKHFNKKVISNNLKRIKDTQSQYKLNKSQRKKNTKDVFFIKNPHIFHKRTVLLVDDVYTTGATVNECAKVLYKAGTKLVDVLVLAHGS